MSQQTTCVVADDHPILLDAICRVLKMQGIRVVGTAERGPDALALICSTSPAVALIDLKMPGMSGIEIAAALDAYDCQTRIILYTGFGDAPLLSKAFSAGVHGFVSKDAPVEEVVRAVAMVAAGEPYVDPTLAPMILNREAATKPELSARELQVLEMVAEGHTSDAIGLRLEIATETVQNHVQTVMRKLHASSRSQAVATAFRLKLIA